MSSERFLMAIVAACCVAGGAWADSEIVEARRTMAQLPQSVARTLQAQLGDHEAEEIEEIRYEGAPILYEAEFTANGREVEIVIRPNGELVPPAGRQGDDDVENGVEDDAVAADVASEREVALADLPGPAADTVRRLLRRRAAADIDEVIYEGVVVLYELEIDGPVGEEDDDGGHDDVDELFVWPDGTIAERIGDVVEREVSIEHVPAVVAEALLAQLMNAQPHEVEEIRYDGIPVLYEAELEVNGQEREVAVLPNGQLVPPGDEHSESVTERELAIGNVPRAVAEALQAHLNGAIREVEEIRYEGVVVLYEAETADQEVAVYPDGELAGRAREGDDDDEENDDEGDDEEDDDDGEGDDENGGDGDDD